MEVIKNILVAVDFCESSKNVLKNAILFAKVYSSTITIMHVLPDDISNEKVLALVENGAKDQLKKVNASIAEEGVETGRPILVFGNYADAIVKEVDRLDANLLVIGAGEKAKNDAFQLGSTADRIVRLSNIPVFVVKGTQTLEVKNLICPVDFSKESSWALKSAISISKLFKAKLLVFSVCPSFKSSGYSLRRSEAFFSDFRLKEQERDFSKFLAEFDFSEIEYKTELLAGDPAHKIIEAIKANHSDLLLMGTTGKSGISRIFMGSVTEKVIRQVLCSFITFKNDNAISEA